MVIYSITSKLLLGEAALNQLLCAMEARIGLNRVS